jgi:Fe-S-cluster containining protein
MQSEVRSLKDQKNKNDRPQLQTKPDVIQSIKFLKPEEEFLFACALCGECCRNVEYSVMLEAYDLFRIARYLRQTGYSVTGIETVIQEYTEIKMLPETDYPVFLLKTRGHRKECVFLKEGRCAIHDAKPRACRLYPLGAWPNKSMNGFDYFIASKRQHHFKTSTIQVCDWISANFGSSDMEAVLLDAVTLAEQVPILKALWTKGADIRSMLHPLILLKYVMFELDEPFIPQYRRNMETLKKTLLGMASGYEENFNGKLYSSSAD